MGVTVEDINQPITKVRYQPASKHGTDPGHAGRRQELLQPSDRVRGDRKKGIDLNLTTVAWVIDPSTRDTHVFPSLDPAKQPLHRNRRPILRLETSNGEAAVFRPVDNTGKTTLDRNLILGR
jgi:hypothetical protein